MTVGLKALGQNSYELTVTSSDTASTILKALDSAVTSKLDSGYYENANDTSVSEFDSGYLEDFRKLPVSIVAGSGMILADPVYNKKAFRFNNSNINATITFAGSDWTIEFDYMRAMTSDYPMMATVEMNTTVGRPYLQFNEDGTATLAIGSNLYTVAFGSPSLNVMHRWTLMLKSNVLYAFIDGALCTAVTASSTYGFDPSYTNGNITLSNNNKTATTNSGWVATHGNVGISSGKVYWELRVESAGSMMFGISRQALSLSTNLGASNESAGLYLGGNGWYNGLAGVTYTYPDVAYPASVGNIFMFALDMDNQCLYVGLNGRWFNNAIPTSGASKNGAMLKSLPIQTYYPAISFSGGGASLKASTNDVVYGVPSGYRGLGDAIANSIPVSGSLPGGMSALTLGTVKGYATYAAFQGFNLAASSSVMSYSNSNRTVYNPTGNWYNARHNIGKSSGKWYWEVYLNTNITGMLGMANANMPTSSNFGASGTWGLYLGGNGVYNGIGGSYTNPSSSYTGNSGNIYMFALDMDNLVLYMGVNGVWLNSGVPTSGAAHTGAIAWGFTAQTYFPGVSLVTGQITVRADSTEFSYTPPTGYSGIGQPPSTLYSSGHMRNLRISKKARYTNAGFAVDLNTGFPLSAGDTDWSTVAGYAAMDDVSASTTFTLYSAVDAASYNLDAGTFVDSLRAWELYDANASATARCYRTKTLDGTYKYVVLDVNSNQYVLIKVYESWDAAAHTGTNLCYNSDSTSFAPRAAFSSSATASNVLNVFATDLWLAIYGSNSAANGLVGCYEISKDDDAEPNGTYPRFAWVNQNHLFGYNMPQQPWGTLNGQTYNCFSLPRTVSGAVGASAAQSQMTGSLANHITATATSVSYSCVVGGGGSYSWCNVYCYTSYYSYNPSVTGPAWKRLLEDMLPTGINPWVTSGNNNYVFSAYAVDTDVNYFHVRGRFYGLKLLANNVGNTGDTINIKQDGNGLYSQTGKSVTHMVFKLSTGGCVAIPLSL